MILITGGAFQGKLEAAEELFSEREDGKEPLVLEGTQKEPEGLQKADIIHDFHLWIRSILEEGKEPYEMTEKLLEANPNVIIILNQMGCGIVPMDPFDRKYRETVGRIGCMLAKRAEEVYLLNCQIARRLK
ncbi:MAG: adenosylcobinamide kinase [Lachnospiraceae bacterium]|nr:adenosylcobinamide kinase [Lachnospiraceae bacterium]